MNKMTDMAMTKKKQRNIVYIILALLVSVWVFWVITDNQKLNKNHSLSTGKIVQCTVGGRGNGGNLNIDFVYSINDKKYNGSAAYNDQKFPLEICTKYFPGRTFPVVYYPPNPSNSTIMITPKDFKQYGYSFPDSLKWVLDHVKE